MNGGKNRKPRMSGYTIIEVLIFMAISGFMFVVAAIFINGKQANAEFRQSINDINTQIRTAMDDVTNGFYPSNNDFTCKVVGAVAPPTFTPAASEQGTNGSSDAVSGTSGCVFMGKVIQFGVHGSADSTGWADYKIYTIAGRQFAVNGTTQPPQDFSQALPTAVDQNAPPVNITETKTLQWGLRVSAMYDLSTGAPVSIGAIGIFGSFGNFTGGNLQSGSQTAGIATIPNTALNQTENTMVNNIANRVTPITAEATPNILVCVRDGHGRKAGVTIGGQNGQQLSTSVKIGDSRCAS